MADTANFGWTKPTVGGDSGAWGTILNTLFDDADNDLNTVKTTADAAMPKSGGTFTGNIKVDTATAQIHNLGSRSGTIDNADGYTLANANYFYMTMSGNATMGVPGGLPASGTLASWVIEMTNTTDALSWNTAYDWPGGVAPNQTENGTDVYVCWTRDGGSNIFAVKIAEDVS